MLSPLQEHTQAFPPHFLLSIPLCDPPSSHASQCSTSNSCEVDTSFNNVNQQQAGVLYKLGMKKIPEHMLVDFL